MELVCSLRTKRESLSRMIWVCSIHYCTQPRQEIVSAHFGLAIGSFDSFVGWFFVASSLSDFPFEFWWLYSSNDLRDHEWKRVRSLAPHLSIVEQSLSSFISLGFWVLQIESLIWCEALRSVSQKVSFGLCYCRTPACTPQHSHRDSKFDVVSFY